jgi:hypothetical protein
VGQRYQQHRHSVVGAWDWRGQADPLDAPPGAAARRLPVLRGRRRAEHGAPAMTAEELAKKIGELSPANRLRLAAEMIDKGQYSLARPIIKTIGYELDAVHLLGGKLK